MTLHHSTQMDAPVELVALRQRLIEMEQENAALRQQQSLLQMEQENAALRQQQSLLQAVIDNAPMSIFVKDTQGHYLLANQPFVADLHLSPEQVIGKTNADLFPAALAATFDANDRQVLATGLPLKSEATNDSSTFLVTLYPLLDEHQAVYAISGMAVDITDRKCAEQELHATNQRLERVVASTPLSIIEFGRDGCITHWNTSAERNFGWSADEALGQELLPLIVPDIAMEQVEAVRDALFNGQITNSRHVNMTKDGRMITCQWHNNVIRDEQGDVVAMLCQIEDISEQVRREEELQLFKTIVEHANDAIGFSDIHGTIIFSNHAHRTLFGYGDEIIGISVSQTIAPESYELLQIGMQEVLTHGNWRSESVNRRKDGSTLPVELSIFMVQDDNGAFQAMVGIVRDITERKRAEEERVALQQQIIDAQRIAIRELSTPIIPISDTAMIMPLIGTIDSARAEQVLETLLEGVTQYRAAIAILDITGVMVVDTQVASALIRAAQAVKLLGAQVVITGIRPDVAQTLVHLGADLSGIVTRGTLQSGIGYALAQSSRVAR